MTTSASGRSRSAGVRTSSAKARKTAVPVAAATPRPATIPSSARAPITVSVLCRQVEKPRPKAPARSPRRPKAVLSLPPPPGRLIRFPADVFGDGSCGVTRPVGWALACRRRTRGGGGGALERGGAGGAVPRRGGRPLGPARPGDLAAGEGSRGGRGGRDDRVRGAVGREAAGEVHRRARG